MEDKEQEIQLSSPDGLDQLIKITSSKGWLALFGVFILLCGIIAWSFLGRIPISIYGKGILLKPGGVLRIVSVSPGQIKKIRVQAGDNIKKGQIVVDIDTPKNVSKLKYEQSQLKELQRYFKSLAEMRTKAARYESKKVYHNIKNKKIEILSLQKLIESSSKIISPYTGRVLEILAEEGTFLKQDTPILHLEKSGKKADDLEAVIYVSPTIGKRIKPKMKAFISPATVKQEEYGLLVGSVTSVSEFPATFEGMMRILKNSKLVNTLSKEGSPIEVRVQLMLNPNTISKYQWTSPKGPPIKIQSGTICKSFITTKEQRPIELLLPFIKDIFK